MLISAPRKRNLIAASGVLIGAGLIVAGYWFFTTQPKQLFESHFDKVLDSRLRAKSPVVDGFHPKNAKRDGIRFDRAEMVRQVRAMQSAQTSMAQGNEHAAQQLRLSMSQLGAIFGDIEVQQFTIEDLDLIALYILLGGNPEIVDRVISSTTLPESRRRLLTGAVAFVRGDTKSADEKFRDLNTSRFPDSLAARVLMVQAQLEDDSPFVVRRSKLAKAASLALGTLIEEAANRRLVLLAAVHGSLNDFTYWSDRYVRRFPTSLYFSDFGQDFVSGVLLFERSTRVIGTFWLESFFDKLDHDVALAFAARLQKGAVSQGSPRLCTFGQKTASKLRPKDKKVDERFRLYELVCQIKRAPSDLDVKLGAIDVGLLDGPDQALLASAKALVDGITTESSFPPQTVYGPMPQIEVSATAKSIEASVAQQLSATEEVLKKAKQ
jgi:chemotaxis protein MotC